MTAEIPIADGRGETDWADRLAVLTDDVERIERQVPDSASIELKTYPEKCRLEIEIPYNDN